MSGTTIAILVLLATQSATTPSPAAILYEGDRANVSFEPGQLSKEQIERFVSQVERGIKDIESYLNGGARLVRPDAKISYRVASDIPMSRSFRRSVLLPMERVKTETAPYLHETTHVLMPLRGGDMWLGEGFCSYVQSYVAEHIGGYDGYVFSWGGNANVDRLARRALAQEAGKSVLPYVGGPGIPDAIWQERRQVAAPFYVLSHSFVKYLIEKGGLPLVQDMVRADDAGAALERSTKRNLAQWKADWLLSLDSSATPPRSP